jgi:hypothetical protein
MRPRLIALILSAALLAPAPAGARPGDARYVREAIEATSAAVTRLQVHVQVQGDTALNHALRAQMVRLEPALTRLGQRTALEDSVSYRVLARMDHTPFSHDAAPINDVSLTHDFETMTFVLNTGLLDLYDEAIGVASRQQLFAPLDSLNKHGRQEALGVAQEALRRYELKYGPGSARLNLLEALANHLLQPSPWFGPGAGGPGPWELIAGYSSTYGTITGEKLRAVSAVEFGLRHYFYMEGGGEDSGWRGYMKPRFLTFGVLISGAEDGALRAPGGAGESRIGGFISWGGIKAAYIGGTEARFMLSRQVQLIPNVF